MTARVLIVQESLPQYRVPLFNGLRERLALHGIHLDVAHGQPVGPVAARNDGGELPWSRRFENRRLSIGKRYVASQPVYRASASYELVIVEQASRLVTNYVLLGRQAFGGPRIALWGHGANLDPGGTVTVAASRAMARRPHWWFAYTEGSAARVRAAGFTTERITVVQNATDTSWASGRSASKVPGRCVVIGSLYRDKRLDFLIAAADAVAHRCSAFELVIVGDGPERARVEAWAASRPYLTYRGALFGGAKAADLLSASLVLNPGRVGLGVLDAFAAGAPVVTTRGSHHSPEIEYLRHASNGWMTENHVKAYADAVTTLLDRPDLVAAARSACRADAARYSVDTMADRFTTGILAALAAAPSGVTLMRSPGRPG